MNKAAYIFLALITLLTSCNSEGEYKFTSEVPDLTMPGNGLSFNEIKDYKNYKIIATHFRNDKNELRYILANEIAFKAFSRNTAFPDGSKIVKIGWNTQQMPNYGSAIEAKEVQRIEYMIKDSKSFSQNPGNWGYARFVKKDGKYSSWNKKTLSCISCHNSAKNNDYLFTRFQQLQ